MQTSRIKLNNNICDQSERIFAFHLDRMRIQHVLDIGSNSGQFALKLRKLGYSGTIYSVEPQIKAYTKLVEISRSDPRWIPLPRQAVGSERSTSLINISENSWSSSLLPVHDNHLLAESTTNTIATEQVFVNKSADLLDPSIMQNIEALKIDVQGYESEVLKGYLPFLSNIRLLVLEMSLVECYVGAPTMMALDEWLVNDLKFSRISFEPTFYDENNGIAQQYDGIYYRPMALPAECHMLSNKIDVLLTSLGGDSKRVRLDGKDMGPAWRQYCISSWKNVATTVISVSETAPNIEGIQFHPVLKRPSIAEMLRSVSQNSTGHVLLLNADIAITPEFLGCLDRLDPLAVYYGSRTEVYTSSENPNFLIKKGVYNLGFDYFLLPSGFISKITQSNIIPEVFQIGEPWWDYIIQLVAFSLGYPVKRLPDQPTLAMHYMHEPKYLPEKWITNGCLFLQFSESLLERKDCRSSELIRLILAPSENQISKLHRASKIMSEAIP